MSTFRVYVFHPTSWEFEGSIFVNNEGHEAGENFIYERLIVGATISPLSNIWKRQTCMAVGEEHFKHPLEEVRASLAFPGGIFREGNVFTETLEVHILCHVIKWSYEARNCTKSSMKGITYTMTHILGNFSKKTQFSPDEQLISLDAAYAALQIVELRRQRLERRARVVEVAVELLQCRSVRL